MKYKFNRIFLVIFISILLYGCDSDQPSGLLIGDWACETESKDNSTFLEFKKDNNLQMIRKVGANVSFYDLKYYKQIESENDIIITLQREDNSDNKIDWTIEFKNKKLINIKQGNKLIEICRKTK